jgi:hypothetical protein
VSPTNLGDEIDWLFKRAIDDLTSSVEQKRGRLLEAAQAQRAKLPEEFPEPGDDPELFDIIAEAVEPFSSTPLPPDVMRALVRRIKSHLTQENKRKNLIGEGFEDVLAGIIARLETLGSHTVHTRAVLHDLPGFNPARGSDKVKKVDLALVRGSTGPRTLITAKWSIRADREEQLVSCPGNTLT